MSIAKAEAVLSAVLVMCGCGTASQQVTLGSDVRESCGRPPDADYYFPRSVFQHPDVNDEVARREYSAYLHVSKEAPLSCGSTRVGQETYRLVLLHPFLPAPKVLRWIHSQEGDQLTLTALRGDATGQLDVESQSVKSLSNTQRRKIRLLFDESNFWFSPTYKIPFHAGIVFDPYNWILEGRQGAKYHVIVRSTADDASTRFAEALLDAAGIAIAEK